MVAFWDLLSYALTAQLLFLVAGHARRSIASFSSVVALMRAASLSVLCHLLALSAASYLEYTSSSSPSSESDSSAQQEEEEPQFPFQVSAASILLLTFVFLAGELFLEAVAWLDGVFVPMVKGVRHFYFRWSDRALVLEPQTVAHAPGVDLRGKIMGNTA